MTRGLQTGTARPLAARRVRKRCRWPPALLLLALTLGTSACSQGAGALHSLRAWWLERQGVNPEPVSLKRPQAQPLSAIAQLGRTIYFDPALSISGRMSCATCHDPAQAYGPPNDLPAQLGGPDLKSQGLRAAPSLTYRYRLPPFTIGPDTGGDEYAAAPALASAIKHAPVHPDGPKTAGTVAPGSDLVPRGGLFWDGRANSLKDQAAGPLFNPSEMGNTDVQSVADALRRATYGDRFAKLFGAWVFDDPHLMVTEALLAIARFQVEDVSFHRYTSKFDYWLEGRARLTPAEMRGYRLFNDSARANCGGCHIDTVGMDNQPPMLTDNEYEALAVPRNPALVANRDPDYFDLGLCGPVRTDLVKQPQLCGMFRTPSLRNVARRHVFFHNGRYRSLLQVLEFYNFRDTEPERIYPKRSDGSVALYDDLPSDARGNVDVTDAPFGRRKDNHPAMSRQDMDDIVAFLQTLTDGYPLDGH